MALNEAFARGEAAVVAPLQYSALAWAVAIDWILWQTLPDGTTLIGAAVIIGSGLYLLGYERARAEAEHPWKAASFGALSAGARLVCLPLY